MSFKKLGVSPEEFEKHKSDVTNPHKVTKSQVGLSNVDNVKQATKAEFDAHIADKNNPHGVTKTQVGLGSVDNVKQATKVEFDAHNANENNPHKVTKAQVGLGSVDNAKQATKVEFDAHTEDKTNPHGVTKAQVGLTSVLNYGVATQVEAETGTSNAKYMTPLRTKQSVDVATKVVDNKLETHKSDANNPHAVTKAQVGLTNVDNVKQASKLEFDTHTKQIASTDKLGHVKVGAGLSISDDGSLSVKRVPKLFNTYTVIIDETNSNPETALTYADDAINLQPKSNEFLDFLGAKPCLLKAGKVVGYLNPNDFSKFENGSTADITSGNAGDVMIEFPKRGINIQRRGTNLYVSMTDELNNPSFSYLAHTKGDKQVDNIYIGAYKAFVDGGKMRSLSGKTPTSNKTIGTFRTEAQANGDGYQQSQWYHLVYRQVAYILYAKNLDSQTAIGRGYVDGNSSALTTGSTDKLGMIYGETTGKKSVKVFGIEDFWGNVFEWIDGVGTDSSYNLQVSTEDFNDSRSGYKVINNSISSNTGGYMSSSLGDVESGFAPREVAGSASTYYADGAYLYNDKIARFGGSWAAASAAGAFFLYVNLAPSSVHTSISARLSFS